MIVEAHLRPSEINIRPVRDGISGTDKVHSSLDKSLKSTKIDIDSFIRRIDKFQNNIEIPPLTDELIAVAKEEGRL